MSIFPRQPEQAGNWVVEYQFLRKIAEEVERNEISAPIEETIEAVLLAAEKLAPEKLAPSDDSRIAALEAENARLRDTVAFQKQVIVEGEDIIERLREAVRWAADMFAKDTVEHTIGGELVQDILLRRAGMEEGR